MDPVITGRRGGQESQPLQPHKHAARWPHLEWSRSAGVKEGAWAGETTACERGRGEGLAAGVLEGVVVADELAAGGAEVDDVAAGSLGGDAAAPVVWQPRIWDRDGQTESHHGRILRKPGADRRSGVGTEKTRRGRGR